MSPYQIVFDKACHLLIKIAHSAYWAIKKCNMAYDQVDREWKLLRLIVGKLHSRWDGPFVVTNIFSYDIVEVRDEANNYTFKVNWHQLKPYREGLNLSSNQGDVEIVELIELVILEEPPEEIPKPLHAQFH
ncbi:hypothetical protein CR513_02909, partial [Mucuna pruriens]